MRAMAENRVVLDGKTRSARVPVRRPLGPATFARGSAWACGLSLKSYLQSNSVVTIVFMKPFLAAPGAFLVKMVFSSRVRSICSLAVARLAALAVMVIAPTQLQADCGHGITSSVGRSSISSISGLEVLSQSGALSAEPASTAPRPDRPCSGPTCSGKREMPHAPARSAPVTSEFWCDTIAALWSTAPDSTDRNIPVMAVLPRHASSPPDRPPRGASPTAHS
jgi:hypothetical protein